ncbi:MAG: hypothetical protein GXP62_10375 [Oligoflexia bacterium]|nr:hypothetical protein [Oligoflexia bacterium]
MFLLILSSLLFSARADDAPPPEDGWLSLDVPADFGSALDATGTIADNEADPDETGLHPSPHLLRGRWGIRPVLAATSLANAWGMDIGGALTHQWWSLYSPSGHEFALRPAGQTELRASGLVGAERGWSLRLDSTHGLWLGPLGLLVGPSLQAERLRTDTVQAPAALSVGPMLRTAIRLGPITPWASLSPAWTVAGDRPALQKAPWDTALLGAGLVLDRRPLGLRLSVERRWLGTNRIAPAGTSVAADQATWRFGLGIYLRAL